MKKRILFAAIAVVLIATAVLVAVLMNASGRDKVTGDTFQTTVGKSFVIALDANATTGYAWTQNVKDPAVVAYVSDTYNAEVRDPQVVGGGGTDTFTFKALARGTTTITLSYARPWESVPAAQTRTITVTVK